jgi:exodeoxyribonuclease VII large subunit
MSDRLPPARPLFDPARMRGRAEGAAGDAAAASAQTGTGPGTLTVSQLAGVIGAALRSGVPVPVRVVGEVSNCRERTHWYFDLKDAGAVVNAVLFAGTARQSAFKPADGVQVLATGRVDFYAPGGKVSLIVERLEPIGAGPLEVRFRQLCEELRGLGWFEVGRKRRLPVFPRAVAVVTSRTGAALADVKDTMRRRCPAVGLYVVDTRVQGEGAAEEIAAALRWVGARSGELGIDGVILTRGGGSMEDLWAFNEKVVARAVLECPVPVSAAIGHETDTTIAELVADERCATPTQAAMRLTPDREALGEQVGAIERRGRDAMAGLMARGGERVRRLAGRASMREGSWIVGAARERAERAAAALARVAADGLRTRRARVDRAAARLERGRPAVVRARREAELEATAERLGRAARARVDGAGLERVVGRVRRATVERVSAMRADTEGVARELEALSPQRVLERGYSVTLGPDGRVVREAGAVGAGDVLTTRVAVGSVRSVVEGVEGGGGAPGAPVGQRGGVRRARRGERAAGQLGLFGG